MRISGQGTGSGGGSRERTAAFRQGRRPGQKVRGLVLRYLASGLALVRIEGQELLAQIQSEPPPGVELLFLIERLTPDIVLKELKPEDPADMDPAALAQAWRGSRAKLAALENARPASSSEDYARWLLQAPEALEAFLDASDYLHHVNRVLDGMAEFTHLPWLGQRFLPQARELEIARLGRRLGRRLDPGEEPAEHSLQAWVLSCLLPAAGRVELRIFLKAPLVRYRILLERMDLAGYVYVDGYWDYRQNGYVWAIADRGADRRGRGEPARGLRRGAFLAHGLQAFFRIFCQGMT